MRTKEAIRIVPAEYRTYNFREFVTFTDELVKAKRTSGPDQTEEKVAATALNLQRMKRIEKTTVLNPELLAAVDQLGRRLVWLVIAEAWCGDASQNLPVLNKIAENSNGKIEMKVVLRDEYPELMDQFLTNGSRSIPKLLCIDAESSEVLGIWGPRPQEIQKQFLQFKSEGTAKTHQELVYQVHLFYAQDKTASLQKEIVFLLQSLAK